MFPTADGTCKDNRLFAFNLCAQRNTLEEFSHLKPRTVTQLPCNVHYSTSWQVVARSCQLSQNRYKVLLLCSKTYERCNYCFDGKWSLFPVFQFHYH